MRSHIYKSLLIVLLSVMVQPLFSQDFMTVFFKNGDFRKFYLSDITEMFASQYDSDGVPHTGFEFQHIKTASEEYVYSLEDVDSISFVKRDEVKEEENFVAAMTSVLPIIEQCSSLEEVTSQIDAISAEDGVERAWTDDHQLYISIDEGEVISFHFSHDEKDDSSDEDFAAEVKSLLPRLGSLVKPDGSRLKVAIANQQDKDESRKGQKKNFLKLASALRGCVIDVDYIPNPSVEFFYNNSANPSDHLNAYDYDIVIFSTHGSYSKYINYDYWLGDSYGSKVHSVVLADDLFKEKAESESDDDKPDWHDNFKKFKKWRKKLGIEGISDQHISYTIGAETRDGVRYWVAHPKLSELFFRDIAPGTFKNPNSIFFNCACQSLKDNDVFAEELITNHGLGVYVGYTESNYFGQAASCSLFSKMFSTLSLEKAYQELPSYMRHETLGNINISSDFDIDDKVYYKKKGVFDARLRILPENNVNVDQLFVVPVYTNFTSHESVMEQYNKSQVVKLSATITVLSDVKNIGLGFRYGTGNILTEDIEAISVNEIFNLGQGNYTFTSELSNLEPGTTYNYQAYTFDGLHRNYGEVYSFTIDGPNPREQLLHETVGNVEYAIYKQVLNKDDCHINPDGWKCYRSQLTLTITKNGTTTTHVLDDNIYLDIQTGHHWGQVPCMLINHNTGKMMLFINSKDAANKYTMDGYCYVSPLDNINFTRETVFSGGNHGWFPYFTDASTLEHFSYHGYYAMISKRSSSGSWSTSRSKRINPDPFREASYTHPSILVIGNP